MMCDRDDFDRREAEFKKELIDLCIKHGVMLVASANPTNNIICDPKIEIYPKSDDPSDLTYYLD